MGTLVTSSESQLVDTLFLEAVKARQNQGLTQNQMIMAIVTLYKGIDEGVIKLPNPPSEENIKAFKEQIDQLLAKAAQMEQENPSEMESEVRTMIEKNRDKLIEFYAKTHNGQSPPSDLKSTLFEFIVGHSVKTKGIDANLNAIFSGLQIAGAMAQQTDRSTMPPPPARGGEVSLPAHG